MCIHCNKNHTIKLGKTSNNKQRFLCKNSECTVRTFITDYSHQGYHPKTKEKIIEMVLSGAKVRDTVEALRVSSATVVSEMKKFRSSKQCDSLSS
ncbi:hypothetical protein BGC07_09785 [Piscirickettsia litoralis]|uniref:Insertion element IS1 protein InsA helix-turn-helix domain-containing protein n=1 Tax=Piscirickettsia litoralis TaxID=1891921 RepID=A0ABX3A6T5_9GAMM|nr:hypothetical protein BGC07_09785 [Piscirickettsia litoralis]